MNYIIVTGNFMKLNVIFRRIIVFSAVLFILIAQKPSYSQSEELVNFKNVNGTWSLVYGNDYGYNFKFGKNYRAVVILYLNTSSIIFKGIYTIEDKGKLRINISEMKREEKIKNLNTRSGFNKAKSSYFIFHGKLIKEESGKFLELRPVKISIDGNDSEGFFEPLIKLEQEK